MSRANILPNRSYKLMKNTNYILRARLQLLGILSVIAVFVIILTLKFGCHKATSNLSEKKKEKKVSVISNPYPEPKFLQDSELIPFVQQLDWSKAKYNNFALPKITEYPKAGILIDLNTNEVLWAKNVQKQLPIASMSKIMTILLALEEIKYGTKGISFASTVKASRQCAAVRVGAMGLVPNQNYKLEELMQAAAIRSANDTAAQIAEFIGGNSMENFIALMNKKAAQLQMKNTFFINPHGLPVGKNDNLSSVLDVAIMANEILRYPEYMKWAKTYQLFAVNNTKEITNTNNLVRKRKTPGVDGLKTGYTVRAGYCLAFSCMRNGRRMLGVVVGFKQARNRDNFAEAILDWGYKQ